MTGQKPDRPPIGQFLRDARVAAGLTQRALAGRLHRVRSYPAKIEAGDRRLHVEEFVDYARAIGVDPVELFTNFIKMS